MQLLRLVCLLGSLSLYMGSHIGSASADGPSDRVPPLAQAELPRATFKEAKSIEQSKPESLSDSEEQSVIDFVKANQPKLQQLLTFLKNKQPAQYQQAIREVSRTKSRLSNLENRDKEMYAIELELWQVRSQLRMLTAEISVSKAEAKEKLTEKLKNLAEQEAKLELQRLTLEHSRLATRVEQLENQIRERSEDPEAAINKLIKFWENRASKQGKPKRTEPTEPRLNPTN